MDEFAEKLLEELDFNQEALNLRDFKRNFADDDACRSRACTSPLLAPRARDGLASPGVRCTAEGAFESPEARRMFLQNGVESGLRQLLDFGLFHGDPHPGNVLALPSGDIAYVDFGNVAEISRANQESLIDAVVHVMNKRLRRARGVPERPRVSWSRAATCAGGGGFGGGVGHRHAQRIASNGNFSFRGLTKEFNKLLFSTRFACPSAFSLVIRALLTQENICLTLDPSFNFLERGVPVRRAAPADGPRPQPARAAVQGGDRQRASSSGPGLRELVQMAEAGASGGVKVPVRVALDLVADTTKMLATDGAARSMLLDGLRAVPIREHIAQAPELGRDGDGDGGEALLLGQ